MSGFPKSQLNHQTENGQEAYTTPTSRAFCYQGNTGFSHAKDEDDQTEANREGFAGSSAGMSGGQCSEQVFKRVRKNSKYTRLFSRVRSCTLTW